MASSGRGVAAEIEKTDKVESLSEPSGGRSRVGLEAVSSDDPRLQLVDRIATSEPFRKSGRLPPLIRYLAEHSLQHDKAGLTEQAIGRSVFDKPKDFNPAEDSSVRVYMRQLRLRLHEYYQSAARDESMIVEVPKGGYALVFHPATLPHAEADPVLGGAGAVLEAAGATARTAAPVRETARAAFRSPLLPWLLFAMALVVAAFGEYRLRRVVPAGTPPWPLNAVIQENRQTTVVLADATYALRMLGNQELTLDDYIKRDQLRELVARQENSDNVRLFRYLEAAQITSMADAHASAVLAGLAGDLWPNLIFRSAKELTSNMLSNDNFIFVGAKTSNPWVELYESHLNFRFVENVPGGPRYIQNRAPRPGEQLMYTVPENTGASGEDYATIALLPNTGNQGASLLVQGLRLEGTDAAIRFLSNPEQRGELASRLKQGNGGTLPHSFEVLLHAHSVAGSAVSIDCIAVRTLAG